MCRRQQMPTPYDGRDSAGDTILSRHPAGPGISPCKDKEQITMEMRPLEWAPVKRLCLISALLTRCCTLLLCSILRPVGELLKGGQSRFLKALVSKNAAGKREGINPVRLLMFHQNNYIPAVSSLLNAHILGTVKQMWAIFY